MTIEMGGALCDAVRLLNDEGNARCVVLRGDERSFSAGGDLAFLKKRLDDTSVSNQRELRAFYSQFLEIRNLRIPIIAAVSGACIGGGAAVASACDLRIVARSSKIQFNFASLGLHMGMGTSVTLRNAVGAQQSTRLLLTGDVIDGQESERIGWALQCVDDDEVLPAALRLAERIADNDPITVELMIQTIRNMERATLEGALQREADAQAHGFDASQRLRDNVSRMLSRKRS